MLVHEGETRVILADIVKYFITFSHISLISGGQMENDPSLHHVIRDSPPPSWDPDYNLLMVSFPPSPPQRAPNAALQIKMRLCESVYVCARSSGD